MHNPIMAREARSTKGETTQHPSGSPGREASSSLGLPTQDTDFHHGAKNCRLSREREKLEEFNLNIIT